MVLPVPSVGNSSPVASLHRTSALGLSNPRVAKARICSSVTKDGSQTVCGGRIGTSSIFSSSNPIDLDLNTTRVFVRM
jgi:hypothetical protein